MSGQLVGEVLDALEACAIEPGASTEACAIKLGLPQRLALIAIAEKCYTDTRQGHVRIGRIQALTGKSVRTSRRYIAELKAAGLIRVVERGHKPRGKEPVAPRYELSKLVPSKTAEAQTEACAISEKACAISAEACAIDPPRDQRRSNR